MKGKQSIRAFKPYKPNTQTASLILDANESPNYLFDASEKINLKDINRYPDNDATPLKEALAKRFHVDADSLIIGAGSSELIELVIKTFVEPFGKVLSFDPSFSMFHVYTAMHNAEYVTVPLKPPFDVNINDLMQAAKANNPDLIIVCNPNNPTGSLIKKSDIMRLLNATEAPILLDEAYMDFTDELESCFQEVTSLKRLMVTRTFSKAYGLAGARVGYLRANEALIRLLKHVKTPYNMNRLSMHLAVQALNRSKKAREFINGVQTRRERLIEDLRACGITVYEAHGNFVFVKSRETLGKDLLKLGVRIRDFASYEKGFYRITVGTEVENRQLMNALKEVL